MGLLGIFAYLIVLFVRPQDFMPFMLGFPIVDVVASLTIFIGFMNLIAQKKSISLPQIYFIILFLLAVFLSDIANNNLDAAIEQTIFFLKMAAIFFMLILILNSASQLKKAVNFIVILVILLAVQSIYQSIHGVGFAGQSLMPGYEENRVRWIGLWDGPNVLCLLFVITLPFTLESTFTSRSALWRLINLFFTAVLSYGIYLTNSRGGFIGFLSVVFFYILSKSKNKKKALIIGLFSVLIFIGLPKPSRMADMKGETSAHERTWIWEQGINLFREKPILGIGRGQFHVVAHNNFIQNLTEMGLIGAFIYVSLMYLSFKGLFIAYHTFRTKEDFKMMSLIRALFISLVGFNVVTLFVNMEHDPLFVWLGLCATTMNIAHQGKNKSSLRFSMKDAIFVFFIVIVVTIGIYIAAIKNIV